VGLIHTQRIAHGQLQSTETRVVLMPGAYHTAEQYLQAGFDEAVRACAQPLEVTLAIPELSHLTDRRWIAALHDEVVAPARSAAGTSLWLGGVSLGGFMALRFAAQYPQAIDGLCLLAPYLGSRIVAAEIAAHANMASWPEGKLDDDDDERRIWQYVTRLGVSMSATRVFLGLSTGDRFADTQQLLARALPTARSTICALEGEHDWPVWRRLWNRFLDELGKTRE
jgi:pimeloyl-ACP methyl ester carboxylesterase